jgi:hypothetical protein
LIFDPFCDIVVLELRSVFCHHVLGLTKAKNAGKNYPGRKKQEERREPRFRKEDGAPSDAEKVEQEETKPTNP